MSVCRRLGFLFPVLVLCSLFPLRAETGILVPREVFVGDTAEFTFETSAFNAVLDSDSEVVVKNTDIETSSDVTVKSVQIRRTASGGLATVRFVPWTPGFLQLPSFSLKKIRLTPPTVHISSLAEKTGISSLAPARSPLLVPGTTWLLYALIAAGIGICVLLVFAVMNFRRYFVLNPGKRLAGRRLRLLAKELRLLEQRLAKTTIFEWYAQYEACLRRYLGALCYGNSGSILSATAAEISVHLRQVFGSGIIDAAGSDLAGQMEALLSSVDTIRFSGRHSADTRAGHIARAKELTGLLEDAAAIALAASETEGDTKRSTGSRSPAGSSGPANQHDGEVSRV